MSIQRAGGHHFFMGPKALIQVFTGQWSAQIGEQATGETVFPFGQADGGGGAGDGEFGIVEFKVIEGQYFGGCRALQSMPTAPTRSTP